ncbi:MAG: hypothetical protein DRI65_17765, partial [Chloroflexota bacterium]
LHHSSLYVILPALYISIIIRSRYLHLYLYLLIIASKKTDAPGECARKLGLLPIRERFVFIVIFLKSFSNSAELENENSAICVRDVGDVGDVGGQMSGDTI